MYLLRAFGPSGSLVSGMREVSSHIYGSLIYRSSYFCNVMFRLLMAPLPWFSPSFQFGRPFICRNPSTRAPFDIYAPLGYISIFLLAPPLVDEPVDSQMGPKPDLVCAPNAICMVLIKLRRLWCVCSSLRTPDRNIFLSGICPVLAFCVCIAGSRLGEPAILTLYLFTHGGWLVVYGACLGLDVLS